jgi:uncharacterized protein YcfL
MTVMMPCRPRLFDGTFAPSMTPSFSASSRLASLLLLAGLALPGCGKTNAGGSAAAANLPVKGPWDAVKITFAKKDASGAPTFVAENTGQKTVKVVFMDFYGYDAKGTQVAKKELSYNQALKGGEKDANVSTSDVPGAVTWEATYHGIEFEGDAKPTMDYKRAPAKKTKGQ